MTKAAAQTIAERITTEYLQSDYIIPSVFNTDIVTKVAKALVKTSRNSGLARNRGRKKFD